MLISCWSNLCRTHVTFWYVLLRYSYVFITTWLIKLLIILSSHSAINGNEIFHCNCMEVYHLDTAGDNHLLPLYLLRTDRVLSRILNLGRKLSYWVEGGGRAAEAAPVGGSVRGICPLPCEARELEVFEGEIS